MLKSVCLSLFLLFAALPARATCALDVVSDLELIAHSELEDFMIDAREIKGLRPMPFTEGGSHRMHIAEYRGKTVALKEEKDRPTTVMDLPGGGQRRVHYMLWEAIYLRILSQRGFGLNFYGIANINGTLHLVMDYLPNSRIVFGLFKPSFMITPEQFSKFEVRLNEIKDYFTNLGVRMVDFQFLITPDRLEVIDPVQFEMGEGAERFNRDVIAFKMRVLRQSFPVR